MTSTSLSPAELDQLNDMLRGTLCERLGMRLTELSEDGGVMTMPVQGNTQPAGLLHGGATIALAESLASFAGILRARNLYGPTAQGVGTTASATHYRSGRSGLVTATATARHLGRTVASYMVDVRDQDERLLSTVMMSVQMLPPRD
ncbi:PaaI family thioesterase [Helcobacillus massiliensis]|uniref:Uncharacterized protein (TIGR00369 family) n=1 Tax=Helcobacillus massiliensis TaxID=521392 RepID=A0A839QRF0_9MICO|nr:MULTISPECIES: PaaI family thioesterase [Helcobacillus]MBB3022345.1 uncharacterized protein (TIGR00369 family) [Helcobacillus massiliensis]MCG7426435.1 PaaI family thioesterase [Helcobacillus sp. ACRRO]MCT1556984.1 PaaI family thioesterase [Helcobacillus massiliensis]MCT2035373.1 PaaI family thioesterase [Helcobacillus massiliensis]MCT2331412.1 PaaI family thioesterase [Helcobacillus massiliensis]